MTIRSVEPGQAWCRRVGGVRRADHVVAALDDVAGDAGDAGHVPHHVAVAVEKAAVGEIVVLEPGEGERIGRRGIAARLAGVEHGEGTLPAGPGAGEAGLLGRVGAEQPLVVGADQVVPLGLGDHLREGLPRLRPEAAGAAAVEPVELGPGHGEDAAQHQRLDAVGMGLGVDQREAGAPGAAEHRPALDLELLADALDVGDEIPGGVVLDAALGLERPQPRWSNRITR